MKSNTMLGPGFGVIVAMLVPLTSANAQEQCSAVLAQGIYNEYRNYGASFSSTEFRASVCEAIRSSSGSGDNLGGSLTVPIKGVPLTFGFSRGSAEAKTFEKNYCSGETYSSLSSEDMEVYKRWVDPNVVSAWRDCVSASTRGLDIRAGYIGDRGVEFSIEVTQRSKDPVEVRPMVILPENGGACEAQGMDISSSNATLLAGHYKIICSVRPGVTEPVTFSVSTSWGGTSQTVAPVQLRSQEAARLEGKIGEVWERFAGSVLPFNSRSCPIGWTAYEPAMGRFIRGMAVGDAARRDPAGERSPGSVQEDELASHSHVIHVAQTTKEGELHSPSKFETTWAQHSMNSRERQTLAFGGQETRPDNVALLYCIRNK